MAGAPDQRLLPRRISRAQLDDLHEIAIKAAIRDQENAGVDIVSDGELRRDNDIDYFLARMPGVEIAETAKDFASDYYDVTVARAFPDTDPAGPALGLAEDLAFTRAQTAAPVKFSFTGPFSLSRRARNLAYDDAASWCWRSRGY